MPPHLREAKRHFGAQHGTQAEAQQADALDVSAYTYTDDDLAQHSASAMNMVPEYAYSNVQTQRPSYMYDLGSDIGHLEGGRYMMPHTRAPFGASLNRSLSQRKQGPTHHVRSRPAPLTKIGTHRRASRCGRGKAATHGARAAFSGGRNAPCPRRGVCRRTRSSG